MNEEIKCKCLCQYCDKKAHIFDRDLDVYLCGPCFDEIHENEDWK